MPDPDTKLDKSNDILRLTVLNGKGQLRDRGYEILNATSEKYQ